MEKQVVLRANRLVFSGADYGGAATQAVDFVPVVGDEENGFAEAFDSCGDLLFHLPAQEGIECREGLIEHHEVGSGGEHSSQGTALALPAGQLVRAVVFETFKPEGCDEGIDIAAADVWGGDADVFENTHVREKRIVLKQHAGFSLLGREIDSFFRVKKGLAIEDDFTVVRLLNTRDAAQGHAFATAGCSEEGEYFVADIELDVQNKPAEAFMNFTI